MLTVYTSSEAKALENIKVDYEFPENNISPWEQLEWMNAHLEEFKKETVSIKTFSPYILNYLNLILMRGDLDYSRLDVFDAVLDDTLSTGASVSACVRVINKFEPKRLDVITLLSKKFKK